MDGEANFHRGSWNAHAEQLLRPVTVRQMLDAKPAYTGANMAIDGNEVVHVTTVAHLVGLEEYPTKSDFSLEDGTRGRITARRWRSELEDSGVDDIVVPTYVRVVGALERFAGRNYLRVINVRKAADYHELCFHLLDVMVTTLTYERGPPPRDIACPRTSHEPNASQTSRQGIFETSFAMHAMHDSLPASPLSTAVPVPKPSTLRERAPVDPAPASALLNSCTDNDVSDLLGPSCRFVVSQKEDKGKARSDGNVPLRLPSSVPFRRKASYSLASPTVNIPGASSPSKADEAGDRLTPSPIGYTSVDIACSPSSLLRPPCKNKAKVFFPYAMDTRDDPSTDRELPQSLPLHPSSISVLPLELHANISALERRIISVMIDTEQFATPNRRKPVSEYEGVHVNEIMDTLMVDDDDITPLAVDNAINSLISEGYIYTTVDELHLKVTPSP